MKQSYSTNVSVGIAALYSADNIYQAVSYELFKFMAYIFSKTVRSCASLRAVIYANG
jgi:hypothetical protein